MSTLSSPGDHSLAVSTSLEAFFEELLGDALRERQATATEAASCYLVALLRDYARPGHEAAQPLNGSLTLLLADALSSAGTERFERLKTLGDGVLYVRGFFPDHLQNRGVTLEYVDALGARAYGSAASMLRRAGSGPSASQLFDELASNFDSFASVLHAIADRFFSNAALTSEAGVLKVYERWLKTGSNQLAAVLGMQGLVPMRGNGETH
jgi:hypothetical protein